MHYPNSNYRALNLVKIEAAREQGYTGAGVGVAVMDSGIGPHVDFVRGGNRIDAFVDCVRGRRDAYDDSGHGSHVAGLIASNGLDMTGNLIGVAPASHIIAVKVLDAKGNGKVRDVINGLHWILNNKERYNIRVVNISVGTPVTSIEEEDSDLVKEVNRVWDAGLVVVVAAGNNGPGKMTITTPGISRKVITVGSYDDTAMPNYSSRGPTVSCIRKPDLIAPGTGIYSCNNTRRGYTLKSGTSMSTPIVSGAAALLLEKYPFLTNRDVKLRFRDTCTDVRLPPNQQGWGLLNIRRLLG